MKKLTTSDLFSLEEYDKSREEIKRNLLLHKKNRSVKVGDNVLLLFEDYETIKYQVQEMLRIEKIFKEPEINEEISAYTSLIPDGDNLKATMLIMYPDVEERKVMLNKLNDLENNIYLSIDNNKKVFAVSDEDLERTKDGKTSAVHFMRFELTKDMITNIKVGLPIMFGIDHDLYKTEIIVAPKIQRALIIDLD